MPSRPSGGAFLAGGLGGVAHQPLEHGEIVEKAAAAGFGQAAGGVRSVALVALGDFDQARPPAAPADGG